MNGGTQMKAIFFISVIIIGTIVLYSFIWMRRSNLLKKRKKVRTFKTFKVIESKGRTIWYEESKYKVI